MRSGEHSLCGCDNEERACCEDGLSGVGALCDGSAVEEGKSIQSFSGMGQCEDEDEQVGE